MKHMMIASALIALCVGASEARAQDFVVVVNDANSVSELRRDDVANAFLKRSTRLVAVDLSANSAVRDAFSKAVHGRPASAIVSHWQQQIFSGRDVPPPERSSDAAVLEFVRSKPDAIGYVAAGANLGDGVKAIAVR